MRIWSLHPKYLDTRGLVALWRETLLAKHVLEERTQGYKKHPQLHRFKELKNPIDAINQYLSTIYAEAVKREFCFNRDKIDWKFKNCRLKVTRGQMEYETSHLLKKLKERDQKRYWQIRSESFLEAHPLFEIVEGDIECWEIIAK